MWVVSLSYSLLVMLAALWMSNDPDDFRIGEQAIVHVKNEASPDLFTDLYHRSTISLESHSETIDAWLYSPKVKEGSSPSGKCVLMAHGLGAQKDQGLHRYADVFASNEFAVLIMDYRNFGGSSGMPRNLVDPARHVEDYLQAIQWISSSNQSLVQCSSLALWGTSFAGGHVLVAAATVATAASPRPGNSNLTSSSSSSLIKAVISQIPHLDGRTASLASIKKRGVLSTVRLVILGLVDQLRANLFNLPALYVRLINDEESHQLAFMLVSKPELEIYYGRHPKVLLGGWKPWVPARFALYLSRYSPIKALPKLDVPVLFISASKDALCSPDVIRAASEKCRGSCEVLELETDHFSVYSGSFFDVSTKRMVEFLNQNL